MGTLDFPTARELKFIREQTVHCTTSLTGLRKEIGAISLRQDNLQQELNSALETMWEQAKGCRLSGVAEWESAEINAQQNKLANLEKELHGIMDEFSAMRDFVRDVEPRRGAFDLMPDMREMKAVLAYDIREELDRKIAVHKVHVDREREASRNELVDLVSRLSDDLVKLQSNVQQNQWGRQTDYASWVGRLERVEQDVLSRVSEELGVHKADIMRLHALMGNGGALAESSALVAGQQSPRSPKRYAQLSISDRLDQIEQTLGVTTEKNQGLGAAIARLEVRSGVAEPRSTVRQSPAISLFENLGLLIDVINTVTNKHVTSVQDATNKIDQLSGRIATCERHNASSVVEIKKATTGLGDCRTMWDAKLASLRQQLESVARNQADTSNKLAGDGETLRRHTQELDTCKGLITKQDALVERINTMERQLDGSADVHAQDLLRVQSRLDQAHERILACEVHGSSIYATQRAHEAMATETTALHAQHAMLRERLDHYESANNTASDKTSSQLESLKATTAQLSVVGDRLPLVEERMKDAATQHSQELAGCYSKLDCLHDRMGACETHAVSISELSTFATGLERDSVVLAGRVDKLGSILDKTVERQRKEAEVAQSAQAQHIAEVGVIKRQVNDIMALERRVDDMNERLEQFLIELRRASERWQTNHSPLVDRVSCVETALHDKVGGLANDVLALRDVNSKQTKDIEQLKSTVMQHGIATEHFDTRERKHAEDIAATGRQLEHLRGCVSACEIQTASVGELKRAFERLAYEKLDIESQQSNLRSQVDSLGTKMSEVVSEQIQDKEALKHSHEQNAALRASLSQQSAIIDRLDCIEQAWKTSSDKNSDELAANKAKLDHLQSRVSECELQTTSVSDLKVMQTREKTALNGQVKENIDRLESVLRDAVKSLSSDADMARRAQTKLVNDVEDMKAIACRQASVQERLDGVERHFAEEFSRITCKLDNMQDEQSGIKGISCEQRVFTDTEAAIFRDRLGEIEHTLSRFGDEYCKQDTFVRALSEQVAYVDTVKLTQASDGLANDRLDRVERMMNESAKNHGQLLATKNHLELMASRLAACEAQGPLLEDIKKTHGNFSLMADRMDHVEQTLQELRLLLTAQKPRSPDLLSDRSLVGWRAPTSPDIFSDRSLINGGKGRGASVGRLIDVREDVSLNNNGVTTSKSRGVSWAGQRGYKDSIQRELPRSP